MIRPGASRQEVLAATGGTVGVSDVSFGARSSPDPPGLAAVRFARFVFLNNVWLRCVAGFGCGLMPCRGRGLPGPGSCLLSLPSLS
jgi:hypothetical protein